MYQICLFEVLLGPELFRSSLNEVQPVLKRFELKTFSGLTKDLWTSNQETWARHVASWATVASSAK